LLIVDHHATEILPKKAQLIHDLNKSAGLLAYELCKSMALARPNWIGWSTQQRLGSLPGIGSGVRAANDYANLVKVYQFWNLHALIDAQLERLLNHPLLE